MGSLHGSQEVWRSSPDKNNNSGKFCLTWKSWFEQPIPCGMLPVSLFVSPVLDAPFRELWIQLPHWNLLEFPLELLRAPGAAAPSRLS